MKLLLLICQPPPHTHTHRILRGVHLLSSMFRLLIHLKNETFNFSNDRRGTSTSVKGWVTLTEWNKLPGWKVSALENAFMKGFRVNLWGQITLVRTKVLVCGHLLRVFGRITNSKYEKGLPWPDLFSISAPDFPILVGNTDICNQYQINYYKIQTMTFLISTFDAVLSF